jgi:hypothetical protein
MKKIKAMFLIIAVFIFTVSCSSIRTSINSKAPPEDRTIEVKGLVLKYVLIDTAYEIYQVNVENMGGVFRKESYKRMGADTYKHYLWLCDTYDKFDDKMKKYLKDIFESDTHPWALMNVTTRLDDDASVKDIIKALNSSTRLRLKKETKTAVKFFFNSFYENHLKDYIAANRSVFQGYAAQCNEKIREHGPDILGFMENVSGMKFKTSYKPVFYYTLRPIGAMGFNYKDKKISTLQRTCRSYEDLLSVPFHEFSHELFQTFTFSSRFKAISEELKNIEEFEAMWLNGMNRSYDWVGWCEENLVEGFAKYLEYKYYGRLKSSTIYIYDYEFYKYLRDINFDRGIISLEEASINFYKEMIR